MTDDTKDIDAALTPGRDKTAGVRKGGRYVSTGATMLNLALSGHPRKGYKAGHYYFVVGDSSSGKTMATLFTLAEAANNRHFDGYELIFDQPEDGAQMDYEQFFGRRLAGRVRPPSPAGSSTTVEGFYFNLDDACRAGKPFIYVLDSMDCLTTADDEKKFQEHKTASRKPKREPKSGAKPAEPSGSYGTAKAKMNSTTLRGFIPKLAKSGSILIIISQTRDNIAQFSFEKKTRSGGHALRFYACTEIWLSVKDRVKKRVRGKDRQVGIITQVQTKKNRLTGRDRKVTIPFYPSHGIDDVGSCVDYLLAEGHWKDVRGVVTAPEFAFKGTRDELIAEVEGADGEKELQDLAGRVWQDVEAGMAVKRKRRYE